MVAYAYYMRYGMFTGHAAGLKGAKALGPAGCKARARKAAQARWSKARATHAADAGLTPLELLAMLVATLPSKPGRPIWEKHLANLAAWLTAPQ